MKKNLLFIAICTISQMALAQTTVTFKPGPVVGEDASISTSYGCTLSGFPSPLENINGGNATEISYIDWTYNSQGCSRATARTLLRFTELDALVGTQTCIINATLRMYGVPTSGSYGNSYYPGSPFTLSNEGLLSRVVNSWSENTVIWGLAPPGITTVNQVLIPATGSQWNWNTSLDVTHLVQDIIATQNYGFMFQLQTEGIRRSVIFASSDHADSTLWPELEIEYMQCDPNFTYCISTTDPFNATFTVDDPSVNSDYYWTVNGVSVGTNTTYNHQFTSAGPYRVCMFRYLNETECNLFCTKCVNLCVSGDSIVSKPANINSLEQAPSFILNGNFTTGDIDILKIHDISPNPTNNNWNIKLTAVEKGFIELDILDLSGRIIKTEKHLLTQGNNNLSVSSSSLSNGIYIIKIKGDNFSINEKLLKD